MNNTFILSKNINLNQCKIQIYGTKWTKFKRIDNKFYSSGIYFFFGDRNILFFLHISLIHTIHHDEIVWMIKQKYYRLLNQ